MLEKRIEVPAQIAKRKFTRQSCLNTILIDLFSKYMILYNK